jgi:hypothetical protein
MVRAPYANWLMAGDVYPLRRTSFGSSPAKLARPFVSAALKKKLYIRISGLKARYGT